MRSERLIYKHRQRTPLGAWIAVVAVAIVWGVFVSEALALPSALLPEARMAAGATIVIVAFALTFSSLTIAVREGEIAWWYGLGFPRGHLALDELLDASAARAATWQGWGAHLTASGLWRPRGLNAVRLRDVDRHRIVLGTDRPQELLDAIARARWATA